MGFQKKSVFILLLLVCATLTQVYSAAILFTDRATFLSNLGVVGFESFETLPNLGNQSSITTPSFTVTNSAGLISAPGTPSFTVTDGTRNLQVSASSSSPVVFNFSNGIRAFGTDLSDALDFGVAGHSLTLTTNNGESFSPAIVSPIPNQAVVFVGIIADADFTTVSFSHSTGSDGYAFDSVVFSEGTVPEPSSLVFGFLAILAMMHSRIKNS